MDKTVTAVNRICNFLGVALACFMIILIVKSDNVIEMEDVNPEPENQIKYVICNDDDVDQKKINMLNFDLNTICNTHNAQIYIFVGEYANEMYTKISEYSKIESGNDLVLFVISPDNNDIGVVSGGEKRLSMLWINDLRERFESSNSIIERLEMLTQEVESNLEARTFWELNIRYDLVEDGS